MKFNIARKNTPGELLPGPAALRASPRLQWRDLVNCSQAEARALLPAQLAERFCALPLGIISRDAMPVLTVLFGAPLDPAALQAVAFAVSCEIIPETAPRPDVALAISSLYFGSTAQLQEACAAAAPCDVVSQIDLAPRGNDVAARPVPTLLTRLLHRAVAVNASDIHIEPWFDRYRVRYRVDGLLQEEDGTAELAAGTAAQLVRRLKVLCDLSIEDTLHPAEGAFSFSCASHSWRIRLSVLPQKNGDKAVLRLLDSRHGTEPAAGSTDSFAKLGLTEQQEGCLRAFLGADSGCIILAGPTGSGKSTLLYAALEQLNVNWRNIITVEDPVERLLPGLSQVEIAPQRGLGFADLVPALLRQDPDVMMIGEIRDTVTANAALTASITGHLVLTTLHAPNALEVFGRLSQLDVSPQLITSALRLVIAQRLVPLICEHCRSSVTVPPLVRRFFCLDDDVRISRGQGCARCCGNGHSGRIGVYEMLPLSPPLRELLLQDSSAHHLKVPLPALREAALEHGYQPLAAHVRDLLIAGRIAPEMALRACGVSLDILGA